MFAVWNIFGNDNEILETYSQAITELYYKSYGYSLKLLNECLNEDPSFFFAYFPASKVLFETDIQRDALQSINNFFNGMDSPGGQDWIRKLGYSDNELSELIATANLLKGKILMVLSIAYSSLSLEHDLYLKYSRESISCINLAIEIFDNMDSPDKYLLLSDAFRYRGMAKINEINEMYSLDMITVEENNLLDYSSAENDFIQSLVQDSSNSWSIAELYNLSSYDPSRIEESFYYLDMLYHASFETMIETFALSSPPEWIRADKRYWEYIELINEYGKRQQRTNELRESLPEIIGS